MKPRVLPRVLAAAIAAAFLFSPTPAAQDRPRGRESSAKPAASPAASPREIVREIVKRHIRVGDSTSTVTISDVAHVPKGEVHHDDIVAILGKARVEGEVTGDVVVILGSVEISGTVRGDVVGIMSPMHIEETADIGGDLVSIGGPLTRAEGCRVGGESVSLNFLDFVPFIKGGWAGLWKLLFLIKLAKLAALFLMLLLVTALVPRRLSVIAAAFPQRWPMAILAGLIAYCATIVLCILVGITIIGIPLAIGLWFAVKVVKWIGLASILFLMGVTFGRNVFKRDLSHFPAVLGGFAIYAIISLVPIFGGVFSTAMSVLALGISILTRFGSEEPWRKYGAPPPPVAPPPATASGPPPVYAPPAGPGA